jgi:phage terminase large subunit
MLRDATLTSFLEVLNSNRIRHELNKSESVLLMKDTGSRIYFRAVDDFERLRGTNLAWFGLDELTYTAEEAWLRLEGRLRDPRASRLCGFAVWTPKGFDWVYRRFVRNVVAGYEVVLAKPFENRHVLTRSRTFMTAARKLRSQVFRAGSAGRVPERAGRRGLRGFNASGTSGKWKSMERCRCFGPWTSTWIR